MAGTADWTVGRMLFLALFEVLDHSRLNALNRRQLLRLGSHLEVESGRFREAKHSDVMVSPSTFGFLQVLKVLNPIAQRRKGAHAFSPVQDDAGEPDPRVPSSTWPIQT